MRSTWNKKNGFSAKVIRISRSNIALTGRLVEEVQLCVLEINESDLINRQNDNGLEKSEDGSV